MESCPQHPFGHQWQDGLDGGRICVNPGCGARVKPSNRLYWHPMSEAPKDRFILARGDSGYLGTPHRYKAVRWRGFDGKTQDARIANNVPTDEVAGIWIDHGGNHQCEDGRPMTEWTELPD